MGELTQTELAYWAGFFDGEGCIQINKRFCKERKSFRYVLIVEASNAVKAVIEDMRTAFGGSIKTNKNRKKPWQNSSHHLILAPLQAKAFLSKYYLIYA